MANTLQLKSMATNGKTNGPFIFFTGPGLGWMSCALLLFMTALARSSGYLLLLSLLLVGLTVMIIFLTHENIGGLRIEGLFQEIDVASGGHCAVVTVRNSSSSTRYHLRITLALDSRKEGLLAGNILALSPGESYRARIPLPWTEAGQAPHTIRSVTLQSRFPCGLVRSWKTPRRPEKRSFLDLVPVPQPWPTAPDEGQAPVTPQDDQPAALLKPYSNENPSRISWMSSLRTGDLLVRDREPVVTDAPRGHEVLTWFPERNNEAGRIYAAALLNFRQRLSFVIQTGDGREVFSWPRGGVKAQLDVADLESLLTLLNQGIPSAPSPTDDGRST